MEEKIISAYKEMLISGRTDINPYTISQQLGIPEQDFFQLFSSAEDVGRKIWTNLGESVLMELNQSELYNSYPPRQKILSYFFTFFEVARNERTFIVTTLEQDKLLKSYREKFREAMNDIIQEGIAMEDVKERIFSGYYADLLWQLHLSLLRFWKNDDSENFVETEKAVEIYSKVPLEIMGPNLFDSMLETVQFAVRQIDFERIFSTRS